MKTPYSNDATEFSSVKSLAEQRSLSESDVNCKGGSKLWCWFYQLRGWLLIILLVFASLACLLFWMQEQGLQQEMQTLEHEIQQLQGQLKHLQIQEQHTQMIQTREMKRLTAAENWIQATDTQIKNKRLIAEEAKSAVNIMWSPTSERANFLLNADIDATELSLSSQPDAMLSLATLSATPSNDNLTADGLFKIAPMEKRLMKVDSKLYTLQLLSTGSLREAEYFVSNHNQEGLALIYRRIKDGKDNYVVVLGFFQSIKQARDSIKDLPANLRQHKPWVRQYASIQEEIQQANKDTPISDNDNNTVN